MQTGIGLLHPVKLENVNIFMSYLELLTLQDFQFKNKLIEINKDESFKKMLDGNHIFDLMRIIKSTYPTEENIFNYWYDQYVELFKFLFKDDVFHLIENKEEFELYRDLILEFNGMEIEKPNPNPEIQRPKDAWNAIQKAKGGTPTFEDKVCSVALYLGSNISQITLYQLDAYYKRAIKLSVFNASLIGRMFSSEGEIDNWFIEKIQKKEELTISDEDIKGFSIKSIETVPFTKKNKE